MWKVSPITVAMLKNHNGIVKELLKHEGVDVNGKDDKGLTLLHMACLDLSKHGIVDFIKFLLEKGADPNMADLDGLTSLHNLANYVSKVP
jgi:ankyrin repeat protein